MPARMPTPAPWMETATPHLAARCCSTLTRTFQIPRHHVQHRRHGCWQRCSRERPGPGGSAAEGPRGGAGGSPPGRGPAAAGEGLLCSRAPHGLCTFSLPTCIAAHEHAVASCLLFSSPTEANVTIHGWPVTFRGSCVCRTPPGAMPAGATHWPRAACWSGHLSWGTTAFRCVPPCTCARLQAVHPHAASLILSHA